MTVIRLPRGALISSGSSVWLNRMVETTAGATLQIGERLPIAHEEFVGLPRINGALKAPQHRAEDVRHVIAWPYPNIEEPHQPYVGVKRH